MAAHKIDAPNRWREHRFGAGEHRTEIRACAVAPDLRVPWTMIAAGRTHRRMAQGSVGWLSLTRRWDLPESLVVVTPASSCRLTATEFLDAAVGELLEAYATDPAACPVIGVALLVSLWDSEFRKWALFDGNICLASPDAVAALARTVGWTAPVLEDPAMLEVAVRAMADIELVHREPVAMEFTGEFAPRRHQFRLNRWGQRLAERAARHPALTAMAQAACADLDRHLQQHGARYQRHMDLLTRRANEEPGASWRSAQQLPVAVLI